MDRSLEKRLAFGVLALVMLLNAVAVWPELTVGRVSRNDNVSHYTLLAGMVQAVEQGDNPLDFWSPETAFGFSIFRTYQPLAHALVALAYFALGKSVSLMTLFVLARFLAILAMPLSFFAMARMIGFHPLTAAAASLLSPLIAATGPGQLGLEYRSWLGFGVFPQAVATNLLLLSLGLAFRAVRQGRRIALAGAVLGLTCLAHLIYGWMGALTICLLAVIPDPETPRLVRIRRTVMIGSVALVLTVFELIPLFTDGYFMNHSRIEPPMKWDSFGAVQVLEWLFTGGLMDHERIPVLTLLGFAGAGLWLWHYRKTRKLTVTQLWILASAAFWILIFFGRPTWGPLLYLIGATADLHLHRVLAGVQLFLLMLAAAALTEIWRQVGRRSGLAAVGLTALLLAPLVAERAQYLTQYAAEAEQNIRAVDAEQASLASALAMVKERGGRVYSGLETNWGEAFKVGFTPLYSFLSTHQIPAVSYGYNATALPTDIMRRFDELNPAHYRLFDIHSLLAPAMPGTPPFLTPLKDFGRFRVLDAPGAGYFDVVDVAAVVPIDRSNFYDVNDGWMHSEWLARKLYLWLDLRGGAPAGLPRLSPTGPLPAPPAAPADSPGTVTRESQTGQVYEAELDATRPSYALFKMTWHPKWVATVDGKPETTAMISPGFLAVPVTPGHHRIVCRYEPGKWREYLAMAGFLLVGLVVGWEWRQTPPLPKEAPEPEPAPTPLEPEGKKRKKDKGRKR